MDSPPNVLLLVADSLRYDAVFGSDSAETPALDGVASDGVVFDRCYSQGISTAPSMTAMLTGRYPLDYGGHWYVHDDQPTMAEQFRANGYTTAAIHSNPNVSRLRNFDVGFDTFKENILPLGGTHLADRLPDRGLTVLNKAARILSKTPYVPAEEIHDQMFEWIRDADRPWFCWTQYMDTHGPYLPGEDISYRNKFRAERLWRKAAVESPDEITDDEHEELRRNYRLEVEYLDSELGRFLDRLRREGLLDGTIVVFTSDHGDEFGEHGLYGHKNLPYEELVHVPLLVRFPPGLLEDTPEGVDRRVRCIDVLPTVLDAVGADPTPAMADRLEGRSLLPTLAGEAHDYPYVLTEKEMRHEDALRFGFRSERWTYLYDGTDGWGRLFDREGDPAETEDVADSNPDVRKRFETILDERLRAIERTSAGAETPDVEDDAGVQERLEALGYRK